MNIVDQNPNVQRQTTKNSEFEPQVKERTGIIDVIAEDTKTGEVVLVMNEPNEWSGSDEQLLALQERFNAYVSFLLDGEMAETDPELAGKPARIELRCAHMPDASALDLLGLIHDQLTFQEIRLEVLVTNDSSSSRSRGAAS
ncbi:MAG TPA: DUF6572 domain-containing protein [Candidatus Udaeobacter sp.]